MQAGDTQQVIEFAKKECAALAKMKHSSVVTVCLASCFEGDCNTYGCFQGYSFFDEACFTIKKGRWLVSKDKNVANRRIRV